MNQTLFARYKNCLTGKVGAPLDGAGKTIFQIMMVFFMVTLMVTINWNLNTDDHSPLRFALTFYEYPVMFCLALAVRFVVADPLIGVLIGKVIAPRLDGLAKSLAITCANVVCMATVMGGIGMIVAGGGAENFTWARYFGMLPLTYVMAFSISFLVVGPLVKMLYHGFIAHSLTAFCEAPKDKRFTAAWTALTNPKSLIAWDHSKNED